MDEELLKHIGLSENEAKTYLILLKKGSLSVGEAAKATRLKRSNLYNILESLAAKGAAKKVSIGGVVRFEASDPNRLLVLAEKQEEQIRHHKESLALVLPSLLSLYHLSSQKPSVRYYEGLEGLKRVYEDILRTGEDIRLIRSVYDNDREDLNRTVRAQVKKQVKAGIRVRMLAPLTRNTAVRLAEDKANLINRRILPAEGFRLPAQVILYGDAVALTDLKNPDAIISTVIDNKNITETFRVIFEYMWEHAKGEHEQLFASVSK